MGDGRTKTTSPFDGSGPGIVVARAAGIAVFRRSASSSAATAAAAAVSMLMRIDRWGFSIITVDGFDVTILTLWKS